MPVLAVVAAVIAVVNLPDRVPDPAHDTVPGPTPTGQGVYPLPNLDADGNYLWRPWTPGADRGERTPATAELDAALLTALADVDLSRDGVPLASGDQVTGRQEFYLFGISGEPGGDLAEGPSLDTRRPQYHGGLDADTDPGDGFHDRLTVDVVPRGSYERGTGDISRIGSVATGYAPYLVDGCDDYDARPQTELDGPLLHTDYECANSTTPDGEDAIAVTRTRAYDNGVLAEVAIVVVVYRADGNAVVLQTSLTADDARTDLTGGELGLTAATLFDLEAAIPDVIVE